MRLQRKYQVNVMKIISLLTIPFVIILFLLINFFSQDEVRELLDNQTERIINVLSSGEEVKSIPPTIIINKLDAAKDEIMFHRVPVFDDLADETEEYFELSTKTTINNQPYQVIVRSTTVESADLFLSIFLTTMALVLILGGLFVFFNNRLFDKLITPFQHTLSSLKHYTLQDGIGIRYQKSDIDEFDELSKVSSTLTQKVSTDYLNLKQFTENASHEIQTPLAVIRNLVEHISNEDSLTESVSSGIAKIDNAISRLTSLNQGLLLLSKIENRQFDVMQSLDLGECLEREVVNMSELYLDTELFINLREKAPFVLNINPSLAEILVRNLVKNMIAHSESSATKSIVIDSDRIVFSNSGEKALDKVDQLFDRFHKQSNKPNSVGLGLAIVKAICDQNDLEILYAFSDSEHRFTLFKMLNKMH